MSEPAPFEVRAAEAGDLPAITAIYGHHVRAGLGSFEYDPPAEAEMARRHAAVAAQGLPWLVAARGGRILGYAYAALYHGRPGWRHTVEDSVYVDTSAVGRGIGRALLTELVEITTGLGYRQMVAVIGDRANHGSIALHASAGFAHIGVLRSVGHKHGQWVDVVLMQRALGKGETTAPEG